MRSIGIDIGSLSIKIADVELAGRSVILRDFLEIPYSQDVSMDKKIQIIEGLRRVAQHYDISQTKFVVGVSQDHLSIRKKTFPFREKLKITKSLPFELEDEIPFDQDKAVFDAKIIKFHDNSSDVLACACPNKYLAELIQLTNDAGIDPDIISSDGFALANLYTNWWAPPPEADALSQNAVTLEVPSEEGGQRVAIACDLYLHIGHSKTILMILQNQFLIETRSINIGGLEIIKAIQKTYEISYADALKGLQEKGFVLTKNDGASKDQVAFSNTIRTALEGLLIEVKKTILEIESANNATIQSVQLMGGVSHLINIAPFFTQKLGVVTNPLNHLTSGIKVYAQQTNELMKNSAIAIGLAIEGVKRPRNPAINFRKGLFAKEGASASSFFNKWKKTMQYAGALLLVFMIYAYTRDMLTSNLADNAHEALITVAQSPAVGLKGAQAHEGPIHQYINEKKQEIADSKKLSEMAVINSPLDLIQKITESIPQKRNMTLDIRQFSVHNETVNLQGEVASQEQLSTLKNVLRNIAIDKKLQDMPGPISTQAGHVAFSYSLKMNRKSVK